MADVVTMQSVQERISERVRSTFLDLLPQEMFEGLVQQEVQKFTATELPRLVKEEGEKRVRAVLAAEFAKSEWADDWAHGGDKATMGPKARELVLGIVKEAAPDLVAHLFGGLAQVVVQQLRSSAPSRY